MSDGAMLWHRECVQCQRALEAAEARCAQMETMLRTAAVRLTICADRFQACNDAGGQHELSSEVEDWAMEIGVALSDSAIPDTWNPDHPDFAKTDTEQETANPKIKAAIAHLERVLEIASSRNFGCVAAAFVDRDTIKLCLNVLRGALPIEEEQESRDG